MVQNTQFLLVKLFHTPTKHIKLSQLISILHVFTTPLVAQTVKRLSTMRETWVLSLGRKDPGEGNGNPLPYYCLEYPMDRGAW